MPAAHAGLAALVTAPVSASDSLSQIGGYDRHGFTVNGLHLRGSVLVFSRFSLLWHVPRGGVLAVSPRVLAPVHMVRPRPELLLLATGEHSANVNPALYAYLARRGIALEALPTGQAISTFNELVAEGRAVAAALVCATPMTRADACLYVHAPAAAAASPADRLVGRVLARDVDAATAQRLLEGGTRGGGAAMTTEASEEAAAVAAEAAAVAAVSPEAELRAAESLAAAGEESQRLSRLYGYPGALPPDAPIVNAPAAARLAAALTRPASEEDRREAARRAGSRRSSRDSALPDTR